MTTTARAGHTVNSGFLSQTARPHRVPYHMKQRGKEPPPALSDKQESQEQDLLASLLNLLILSL